MDEILLGRPLLKELGLDAPAHLAAVREEFHDRDCTDVPTAAGKGKLSRMMLSSNAALTESPNAIAPERGASKSLRSTFLSLETTHEPESNSPESLPVPELEMCAKAAFFAAPALQLRASEKANLSPPAPLGAH
jgi:hypothetical protein